MYNKYKDRRKKLKRQDRRYTGTKEWSSISMNLISGCFHNCRYCYGKSENIYFGKTRPENWECESVRFNKMMDKVGKKKDLIMYPSTHDIHPFHIDHHIYYLRKILSSGNKVLIVTKPHLSCIERICNEFEQYKSQILFRFTIGSMDSEVLKFWDVNSPSLQERLDSLKLSFNLGFQTSISCEPLFDSNPDKLIETVEPFVTETIWIGKGNLMEQRTSVNGWKDDETKKKLKELKVWMDDDDHMMSIYLRHRDNPKIRWKESLRRQVDGYWGEPDRISETEPETGELDLETTNELFDLLNGFYGNIESYDEYLLIKKQEKIIKYGL